MSKRTIRIAVTRTVQVERFEPATVTVEETIEVTNDKETVKEARAKLYADVTKAVKFAIDNEVAKYGKTKKKREDDDD